MTITRLFFAPLLALGACLPSLGADYCCDLGNYMRPKYDYFAKKVADCTHLVGICAPVAIGLTTVAATTAGLVHLCGLRDGLIASAVVNGTIYWFAQRRSKLNDIEKRFFKPAEDKVKCISFDGTSNKFHQKADRERVPLYLWIFNAETYWEQRPAEKTKVLTNLVEASDIQQAYMYLVNLALELEKSFGNYFGGTVFKALVNDPSLSVKKWHTDDKYESEALTTMLYEKHGSLFDGPYLKDAYLLYCKIMLAQEWLKEISTKLGYPQPA